MIYRDGIRINGKHSFVDFGLSINSRKIELPPKNSIRKTIPFMNGYYDFTKINGDVAWGARQISYTFDIIGATVEEMDYKRTEVVNWLCNVHEADIFDDTIPDYHFHGSFDSTAQNEDGEKDELTVVFVCYPLMIANIPREVLTYEGGTFNVINKGQSLYPLLTTLQSVTVKIGNAQQTISPVADYKLGLVLPMGETQLQITKSNEIVYPYRNTTKTDDGVTFTDDNGIITANGTATDVVYFYIRGASDLYLPPIGKHFIKGCPPNGGTNKYRIQVYVFNGIGNTSTYHYDTGDGVVFETTEITEYVSIAIRIANGYTANDVIFNPEMYGETRLEWAEEVL